jgi:carbonic anhydrase/acetyltransferase-like protein (isoleucine patch superfamily)
MKKFELTAEKKINWFGRELYRIRALISFKTIMGEEVKAGDLGGYVESEKNLSHNEKAWLSGDAKVWGNAEVCGDAKVWGNAEVCGDAKVWGNAEVWGDAEVSDNAEVWGNAKVWGDAKVWGNAEVWGDAKVWDNAEVWGNAKVWGNAEVSGNAEVWGNAEVSGVAKVWGDAKVWGNAEVSGDAEVSDNAEVWGNAKVWGNAEVFSTNHVFTFTPIGASANSLTFFRTKNREIEVSYERYLYSLGGFEKLISNWLDKFKITARLAVEIAKAHIDLAEEPPFGACDACGKEFNSELRGEYEITHYPWCGEEIEG